MGEDSNRKKLAELYFDTNKAEQGLIRIEDRLKNVTILSKTYSEMMQKSFSSLNISKSLEKELASSKRIIDDISKTKLKEAEKTAAIQKRLDYKVQKEIELAREKAIIKEEAQNNRTIKSTKTMYDKIANYAQTYLIYQGFSELRKAAKELIDEMVDVEYQMVQIDRVLNDSSLNINEYRDRLIQLAYDYGNSFDNVADITLRLAQAGFDAQESIALTEKTLLALNTAELNATQATSDMVAVMAQWGLMTGTAAEQANAYGEIIDKINITADNFPTTSADIMEAMKKTSSAFKIAGMDIDETIAIIVAAEKASQRGGKAIGTALSNISQQLKETSRMDIAADLGIDFFKDAEKTEYKDLIDILGELSEKMQQLKDDGKESSVEMQNLLKVFTVFRRNIGASLLGEMSGEDSTYQQVMDILGDPETIGYSMRENAKHMNTAKAAIEQFNATLLQLKTSVWDGGVEDVFKGLLTLSEDIVKAITFLTETFGAVPVTIGMITLAFALFNKTVKETNVETNIASVQMLGMASNTKIGTMAINKLTVAYKAGTISAKEFKLAAIALNGVLSFGLAAGITLVTTGLDYLIHAEEKVTKKHDKRISELKDEAQANREVADEIKQMIDAYEKYSNMGTLNDDQKKDFEEVQDNIVKFLVQQNKWSSELTNNYEAQLNVLKQISEEATKQRIEAEKKAVIEEKEKSFNLRQTAQYNLGSKRWDAIEAAGGDMSLYSMGKSGRDFFKTMPIEEQIDLLTKWEEQIKHAGNEGSKGYEWVSKTLSNLKEISNDTDKAIGVLNSDLANTELDKFLSSNDIKNAEDFQKAINNLQNISVVPEGWEGSLEDYRTLLSELLSLEFPEFQEKNEEVVETFKDAEIIISEYTERLKALQEGYTTLTTAQQELNDSGQISAETFSKIIDQDLLQYLDIANGKLSINSQAYLDLAEAERVAAVEALQHAAVEDIKNLALGKTENLSTLAKTAIDNLGNADATMGNKAQTAAGQIAIMNQELANTIAIQSQGMSEDVVTGFNAGANAIAKSYMDLGKNVIPKIGLSVAKASKGATKSFKDQSEERIKIFKQEIDDLEDLEKQWVNKYKTLDLFGTSDLKFITHQRINRYNEYLNQINGLTGISEEQRTSLLKEYTAERQKLELEYFDLLKDQLEEQIDALEKANDEKIKSIEEAADAEIEALRKVEKENDRIREKEEYEANRNKLLYGDQGIEYWKQRTGREAQLALKEAQEELDELDKEWAEKKEEWTLEEQIEEIENARDAQIKAIEEAQERQIQGWKDAYQKQVELYAQTGQIIYDNSIINAQYLYHAYMDNFVQPFNSKLQEITSAINRANQELDRTSARAGQTNVNTPSLPVYGPVQLKEIPSYQDFQDRLKNVGRYHGGGKVATQAPEALAFVRPNEVVLKPEWAAGLDKLINMANNGNNIANTHNLINNTINIDAELKDKLDMDYLAKRIKKVLKEEFNIKK